MYSQVRTYIKQYNEVSIKDINIRILINVLRGYTHKKKYVLYIIDFKCEIVKVASFLSTYVIR